YYSVISPEACSAILWRDRRHAAEAAEALKLTAQNLLKLEVGDENIAEPEGGAHRDYDCAAANLGEALRRSLEQISQVPVAELLEKRYQKFRRLGVFSEGKTVTVPARVCWDVWDLGQISGGLLGRRFCRWHVRARRQCRVGVPF